MSHTFFSLVKFIELNRAGGESFYKSSFIISSKESGYKGLYGSVSDIVRVKEDNPRDKIYRNPLTQQINHKNPFRYELNPTLKIMIHPLLNMKFRRHLLRRNHSALTDGELLQ